MSGIGRGMAGIGVGRGQTMQSSAGRGVFVGSPPDMMPGYGQAQQSSGFGNSSSGSGRLGVGRGLGMTPLASSRPSYDSPIINPLAGRANGSNIPSTRPTLPMSSPPLISGGRQMRDSNPTGGSSAATRSISPIAALQSAPEPAEQINECEILIAERDDDLENYAEDIETQIGELGLSVSSMYPKSNINIKTFVKELANRGTKISVLVRPEHIEHRSVTIHEVKGGKPLEHRNMPLLDALDFLKRYKQKLRREAITFIPDEAKVALESVLDDEFITDRAYQASIKYLIDRWKRQHEYEGKTEYDTGTGIFSESELIRKIAYVICGDDKIVDPENSARVQAAVKSLIAKSPALSAMNSRQNRSGLPASKFPREN